VIRALLSSAVFWAAVGSIGGIVALLLILRQIRDAHNVAAYQFLRKEDERFSSDSMLRYRSALAYVLLTDPKNNPELANTADYVLGFFEDLGVIMKQQLAPSYMLWSMNAYYVTRYWHALSDYIEWVRVTFDDEMYFTDFEKLFRKMDNMDRRLSGDASTECTDDDMKDFLRDELSAVVRRCERRDLTRIMEIERSAFSASDAYSKEQVLDLYNNHGDGLLVADMLGDVVGYAAGYAEGVDATVDSLAVDRAYRGAGIARVMLVSLLRKFDRLSVASVTLEVRKGNKPAIALYESLGFSVTKDLPGYYDDEDGLEMSRTSTSLSTEEDGGGAKRVDDGE